MGAAAADLRSPPLGALTVAISDPIAVREDFLRRHPAVVGTEGDRDYGSFLRLEAKAGCALPSRAYAEVGDELAWLAHRVTTRALLAGSIVESVEDKGAVYSLVKVSA